MKQAPGKSVLGEAVDASNPALLCVSPWWAAHSRPSSVPRVPGPTGLALALRLHCPSESSDALEWTCCSHSPCSHSRAPPAARCPASTRLHQSDCRAQWQGLLPAPRRCESHQLARDASLCAPSLGAVMGSLPERLASDLLLRIDCSPAGVAWAAGRRPLRARPTNGTCTSSHRRLASIILKLELTGSQ